MKRTYIFPAVKYSSMDTAECCLTAVSLAVTDENVDDSSKAKELDNVDNNSFNSIWDE